MGIMDFRKVPDAGLPARLQEAALNATILDKVSDDVADPAGIVPTALGSEIERTGSPAQVALAKRSALNILDYGVVRGTAASQTVAIKAALDANPRKPFYFPPGDYRLDTGLVISQGNSLYFDNGTRVYAGAAMTTMISYTWAGAGYLEDTVIVGGTFDGNLLANRIMSIQKVIRFTLTRMTFKDGINRGLVTEAGLGAEIYAYDLRFYNTGITNITDNIAIEAGMGDSHFRDMSMRDWTVGVKDTAANRWDRVHPWIGPNQGANTQMTSRYPTSIGFDLTGQSDVFGCLADSFNIGFKIRTNGTGFTPIPRLRNCKVAWADDPTVPTAVMVANPSYCLDNTDGIGADISDMSVKGHVTSPPTFLLGPTTRLDIRNTTSYGFVLGAQGTASDPLNYRGGVQQGSFLFTPTLIGSTSTTNAHTYTLQAGRMVVAGDTTTYFMHVEATLDAAGTFSGSLRIGGLPLPPSATGVRNGSGSVGYAININASGALIFTGTSFVTLMTMDPTGMSEVSVGGQSLRGKVVKIMANVMVTHYKS